MKEKRCGSVIRILAMMCVLALCLIQLPQTQAASDEVVGKLIHVVYDDSGSMVTDGDEYILRWSQAKYAMEVFCAMMGQNDVMNIYPMSQAGGVGLTVYGSDSYRVSAVHDMSAVYYDTPFSTVTAAANNLRGAVASLEKWLVIITDGAFDDGAVTRSEVQDALDGYNAEGIRTVYLAIGDDAVRLDNNPGQGGYSELAADGSQVLFKVTSIANQIFAHQALSGRYISQSGGVTTLDIDIPTDQIVVFAQGDNVAVGDLMLDGQTIRPDSVQHVKYSDVLPENYPEAIADTSLKGVVATFEAGDEPFHSGQFSIPVSGADTIEYYYRPGVTVNCELLYNGQPVQADDTLYAGAYQVELSFVNPLTGQTVSSDLLDAAAFTLTVENNGQTQVLTDASGTVSLVEGDVNIDAVAELPGYVHLSSLRSYTVLPEPMELELRFTPETLTITPDRLGSRQAQVRLRITDKATGAELTHSQASALDLQVEDAMGVTWQTEYTDGAWLLTPVSADGTISGVDTGSYGLAVSASFQDGRQFGFGTGSLDMTLEAYVSSALSVEIQAPDGDYDLNDMDQPQPMRVTVTYENPQTGTFDPLTRDMWENMELRGVSEKKMDWSLERGSEVGTWLLRPEFYSGNALGTDSGPIGITVTAELVSGELRYVGSASQEARFLPLTPASIIRILFWWIVFAILFFWIFIGHMRKKRIPARRLAPNCNYLDVSKAVKIKKSIFSVLWPNGPERATVYCSNATFCCNFPNLRIEAAGKNTFRILNRTMDLSATKIGHERMEDMETVRARTYAYATFRITSVEEGTQEELGVFRFRV